ncbi:MAG TPA: MFS transporter [Candidatus Binatia bacterium]|nr:MFS transporter [Candidatus Binatia bacterium]
MDAPPNNAVTGQRRLFLGSFITLIAAGVGFAVRSGILDDWGREFGFTQTELGAITGSGLWGFGLAIVFFSSLADRVGYGPLMVVAFVLHAISAVLTLGAGFVFAHFGKEPTYWLLYLSMMMFALANGTCEAVINPLTATLYPKAKTHYLNILHAGWPAGLIVGGVLSYFMAEQGERVVVRWQTQWLIFLVPVVCYGWLMFGQKFPVSEAKAAGVPFGTMLREFGQPLLLGLLVLHALVGYVELGTDSWIANLMTNIASMRGILVLVYTSSIMFVLRFCAGPIVHKISPLGLLFSCATLAMIGLFWLGNSTAGVAVFLAATIYGVGKTFFWPTMLGVVSERFPKGGALTLGAIGAAGVFSGGLLGTQGIGYIQDYYAARQLSQEAAPLYQTYAAAGLKSFLFFPQTTGLDGAKVGRIMAKAGADLTEEEKPVRTAVIYGGRMSLKWTGLVPLTMAVGYLLLILYFRAVGGYKQVHLEGALRSEVRISPPTSDL